MNFRLKSLLLGVLLLVFFRVSYADSVAIVKSDPAPQATKSVSKWDPSITGTYSSLKYMEETGDLVGEEVRIYPSNNGYEAIFQSSPGYPDIPVKLNISINVNHVDLSYISDASSSIHISGRIVKNGIQVEEEIPDGKFDVFLKRKRSYWDERVKASNDDKIINISGTFTNLCIDKQTSCLKGDELTVYTTDEGPYAVLQTYASDKPNTPVINIFPLTINQDTNQLKYVNANNSSELYSFVGNYDKKILKCVVQMNGDERKFILIEGQSFWDRD